MNYLRLSAGVVLLACAGGCGLISSDVSNFDLTLPDKNFSVDSAAWQVDPTLARMFLGTQCTTPAPNVCTTAASTACAMNCTGACGAAHTCDLSLQVSVFQPVDLVTEKPELKTINDQPVIKVTIDSVTWEVTANTLNVATPVMNVYVAPMSVMDPADPMAKQVGVINPIDAMMTTTAPQTLAYTETGKQALVDTMSTFKNPFNVIVGSTLTLKNGDTLPTGRLDAVVHIKAHAGL
jgi:hypothetical protein